ncbi:MAG TPA: DUF5666 domain-containing protein [Thermoanaerobaculia bacterium]|nr:DUF5666 domain-containing protein [Thermoanaerobaculia bacterium]
MRKTIALLLLLAGALAGTAAFAHGGKTHRLMGTVKALHENHLTVTTTEGKEATVNLTADTKYERDGKPVDRSALAEGVRVSVHLDEEDKNAVEVKIGAPAEHQH